MKIQPDSSAVRTALWRALHVQLDDLPHLIEDEIGLAIADPEPGWRNRGDMHPQGVAPYRGAIVARTRYVEDLLVEEKISQYVLLGAGLDTFAQRRPSGTEAVTVFEIDQPGPQEWKRQRLDSLGLGVPEHLKLVPVDFESGDDWWGALGDSGFEASERALVSSSGVSMYISKEATASTLAELAQMAPGSLVAMTFMLPIEMADEADRPGLAGAARGAEASGTPWVSFFTPDEIAEMARLAGFSEVRYVPTEAVAGRYLAGRSDGLRAASGEAILLARV